MSLATLMSLMHQEFHAGDTGYYRIPDAAEDIDLYLSSLTRSDLEPFVTEGLHHRPHFGPPQCY